MFGLISRAHHDDVVREKERLIVTLAAEIDWLRMSLGTPTPRPALNPTEQPPMTAGSPFLSDEEEELQYVFEQGHISKTQLEQELAKIGFQNTVIGS